MIELVPKLIPTGPALGVMATLTQYLSDPRADFPVRLANFFMYTVIHPGFLSECVCINSLARLYFFVHPLEVQLRAFLVGGRTVCVQRIF